MTSAPRRPRRDQERNRRALVAAAHEVFAEQGVDAPLDLVARRAGLGNATLYRHFRTRRDLVAVILEGNLERSSQELAVAMDAASGWEGFVGYLSWHLSEQLVNAGYMGALRAIPSGEDPRIDQLRDSTAADLGVLIERAQAEGAMRRDRWIEDVFLVLTLNEAMASTGHEVRGQVTARFLDLALAAFAAPGVVAESSGEPDAVLALRSTLGAELAGLPRDDRT